VVVAKLFREQNVVVKLVLIKTVMRGASKDVQVRRRAVVFARIEN